DGESSKASELPVVLCEIMGNPNGLGYRHSEILGEPNAYGEDQQGSVIETTSYTLATLLNPNDLIMRQSIVEPLGRYFKRKCRSRNSICPRQ
ncbi:MAG: hypothetical protein ABR585_00705, partial [Gemmatimonadaceae bacterium]